MTVGNGRDQSGAPYELHRAGKDTDWKTACFVVTLGRSQADNTAVIDSPVNGTARIAPQKLDQLLSSPAFSPRNSAKFLCPETHAAVE